MANEGALLGVWRLVDAQLQFSDNGEVAQLMGPHPEGVLTFLPGRRMMAIITDTERKLGDSSARLMAGMLAYSGRYTVDGDSFATDVDISWHPSWLGSHQVRYFRLDGDELHITSALQTRPAFPDRPARAMLRWRRES
jgi:hypothetical protein